SAAPPTPSCTRRSTPTRSCSSTSTTATASTATSPRSSNMPAEPPLLQVTDLDVRYGRTTALAGAALTVRRGETVRVIGEAGSGKSPLARAVVGLVAPAAGTVTITGEEVTAFSRRQWRAFRRRGVAQYVFQDPLRS